MGDEEFNKLIVEFTDRYKKIISIMDKYHKKLLEEEYDDNLRPNMVRDISTDSEEIENTYYKLRSNPYYPITKETTRQLYSITGITKKYKSIFRSELANTLKFSTMIINWLYNRDLIDASVYNNFY